MPNRNAMAPTGFLALLLAASAALGAEVAVPRPRWTPVRLVAEEIEITLGERRVRVETICQLHNTGPQATVRIGWPVGPFEKELDAFTVFVDGKVLKNLPTQASPGRPARRRVGPPPRQRLAAGPNPLPGPFRGWKTFDVPFRADERKTLMVAYRVAPAPIADTTKGSLLHYLYPLRTGATWQGNIARAAITVRLDGVSPDRIVQALPAGCERRDGGKTLTWTLTDFKPTHDIEITYRPAPR